MPTSNINRHVLFCILYTTLICLAHAQPDNPDLVVAMDGSGDYIKVQDAINAVPKNKSTRTVIFIKPGTYKEKIRVSADKTNLKLLGESYETTILTYDDHAKTTNDYASTRIYADDFFAEKLTFQNTIDSRKGGAQAAALRVDGDRAMFYQCRITGFQDTYYTGGNKRSYHKECVIEGTTDFIYGDGIALFEDCTIKNRKDSHITAHSQKLKNGKPANKFGYVFKNCDITLYPGEKVSNASLGRPWGNGARVVYLNCTIGAHIRKEGWSQWNGRDNHKTAYYAEYKNSGPGSKPDDRLPWTHQLTDDQAAEYTKVNIFKANTTSAANLEGDWNPVVEEDPELFASEQNGKNTAGPRHRVIISTDIGGTDPDDFQSMVHLLLYADVLDIEGLVSSPFDEGRKEDILKVVDCYENDYPNLKTYSDKYPTADALRAMTKQGETERAPYTGVRQSTEGSEWIIKCARRQDPRPLHILVWGLLEDVAQALHDAPDILPKLRVYWIGGPNKKWSPDAYQYIVDHHPDLWIIESNATYRGWFAGGNQSGQWGNKAFVAQHIAGRGALGDFFVSKKDDVKMGDTPSVGWLLKGTPGDPEQPGWGGSYVRAWERPYVRFDRLTTKDDHMEIFGILELALPLGRGAPDKPEATLEVENQSLGGYVPGDGTVRFRFCPKSKKTFTYRIRGNVRTLNGKAGSITVDLPTPGQATQPSSRFPNWWTDDPDPAMAEGDHHGAKTVNRWREDFLQDFAARIMRCKSPASGDSTNRSQSAPRAALLGAFPMGATPLRVDINSEGRADMRTIGWENWQPAQGNMSQSFGSVTVTLRARDNSGSLSIQGKKAILIHGVTVGAEGAVVTGGNPAVMEVQLEGLTPGKHSFVGYHHAIDGADGTYTLSTGNRKAAGFAPSKSARHNDEVGTSFMMFEAKAGQPVVIRIAASKGDRVLLNGFAIDVSDPHRKALKPVPANYEGHANGDNGKVKLTWTPSDSAVEQHVYMVSDLDPEVAIRKLAAAGKEVNGFPASIKGDSFLASIVPNNSLLHYVWRVDSVDARGEVTRGDVWRFRVRHLAFPTAEGYGRFAIGGRGGRVLHVTNLNDSGPGSLRAAVEATGPRTVVFDVSGLISLESKLVFREENEFLTVAGQTAPGKGICIRNYTFGGLGGRDTIVRFTRLRLGSLTGKTMDGMGLASCDHCIIDHCSISWTIDEAFSSRGARDITFQRNLISEALNIAGHSNYGAGSAHGYAGSISGNVGSFHHSLLAHNAGRNWSLAGATDQANRHAGRLDIRNMVVYNWKHRTTDGGAKEVNFVNNYYKPGPASEVKTYLNPQFENPAFGPQQYYVKGNIMEGVTGPEGPTGTFKGMKVRGQQDAPVTVPEPFFEHYVETYTAREAYENVLADVGCNVPMLDDHDKRVIEEVRSGTTTYQGSRSGLPGLPDSQEDVGGWEDYPEIHRPAGWDTDGDGMPDRWETGKGFNPDNAADGALDPDGDGFTHLEDYLNWLAEGTVLR